MISKIASGSVAAWHEFLKRYTGLIFGVVRRHLSSQDEDEMRTIYVDVLESLYDGELYKYRGEAQLSTWLFVYTRHRSMDFHRRRYGRTRMPSNYDRLSAYDKCVLRLYFVEKLPLEIVVNTLGWYGFSTDIDAIVASIQRIEDIMDRRYLERIENEYKAETYKVDTVRALKYLVQLRLDYEENVNRYRADSRLLEKEILEKASRVRRAIASLSHEEREIVHGRFYRGLTARKIAEEFKLSSERRAYAIIEKALRKLRAAVSVGEDG